jgi:hypothetical protein
VPRRRALSAPKRSRRPPLPAVSVAVTCLLSALRRERRRWSRRLRRRRQQGRGRGRLLETVGQYSRDRLMEADATAATRSGPHARSEPAPAREIRLSIRRSQMIEVALLVPIDLPPLLVADPARSPSTDATRGVLTGCWLSSAAMELGVTLVRSDRGKQDHHLRRSETRQPLVLVKPCSLPRVQHQ